MKAAIGSEPRVPQKRTSIAGLSIRCRHGGHDVEHEDVGDLVNECSVPLTRGLIHREENAIA